MHGRKYFLNVNKGAFSEKTQPGQKVISFTEITGHLVNINFKETDYGEAMRLHVVDENNFYILSIFVHSRPANAFFMLMRNIDFKNEMTFKIFAKDGKDFFSIHQYGGPVLWYYTLDNIRELPIDAIEKKTVLRQYVIDEVIPMLHKQLNPYPTHLLYKPCRKGLHGSYFDGYKTIGKVVGPVSNDEINGFQSSEKW
jgi:hypothetical protein